MGSNLSGGQTALICLARLFLLKPNILILDEALAALEPALNASVFNEIFQVYKNKTCIFVTDYVPVHKKADKIIILQEGQIVEQGSYTQLMAAQGYYFNLYPHQI
jgi:ATP-binding cassette subfamily B protein